MIDLHCHIIPDIDDGAESWDEAAFMMQMAMEGGTKSIVATPHIIDGRWLPAWPDIVGKCQRLQRAAKAMSLNLTVYPGAEVFVDWDILAKINGPGAYCINGSRYMLVELPAVEIPRFADDFFFSLQTKGITPVLAHPERNPAINKDPFILAEWITKGILVQINGPSLTGRFGEKAMRTARHLLAGNMVHFIGSDAHNTRTRKPDLAKSVEKIRQLVGEEQMAQLLIGNPTRIVSDESFEIPDLADLRPVKPATGLRGIFHRLFG